MCFNTKACSRDLKVILKENFVSITPGNARSVMHFQSIFPYFNNPCYIFLKSSDWIPATEFVAKAASVKSL